eukprot:m.70553 g.70553  ORF g.70553 m.70553 type:complete len:193 (-) comp24241_c0_seq1:84-662(-)
MFGLIPAGRLLDTAPTCVDQTKFLFQLQNPETVNHIVVFMTGTTAFPDGYAGSIHFALPGPNPGWQLIGFISNTKPSAIFKLSTLQPQSASKVNFGVVQNTQAAQIGISIEPITELSQKTPDAAAKAPTMMDFELYKSKMLDSLFNFVSSFSISREEVGMRPEQIYVPLSSLSRWQEYFKRQLTLDPLFWKK